MPMGNCRFKVAKNTEALRQNYYPVVHDHFNTVVPKPNDLPGRHNLRSLLLGVHKHLHSRLARGHANIPAILRQHESNWHSGLSRKIAKPTFKKMAKSESTFHRTNRHAENTDGDTDGADNADDTVALELGAQH